MAKFDYESLLKNIKDEGHSGGLDLDMPEIPDGVRNDVLFRIACRAWTQGTPADVLTGYIRYINQERCKPPMGDGEVLKIISQSVRYDRDEYKKAETPEDELWLTPAQLGALAAAEPERRSLCGPLMSASVGFLMAEAGVGKSFFALALAASVASGERFGPWPSQAGKVKYVDAEMTGGEMKERLDLMGYQNLPNLFFDMSTNRDLKEIEPFNLGHPEHQKWLMGAAEDCDLLIIDNVTFTLDPAPGFSLYSPETINQMKPLMSWARRKGVCLVLVDHTNKEGGLHGHSNKNRLAQWTIKLTPQMSDDLSFKVEWPKYRIGKKPLNILCSLVDGVWEIDEDVPLSTKITRYIFNNPGVSNKEVSEAIGCSEKHVFNS